VLLAEAFHVTVGVLFVLGVLGLIVVAVALVVRTLGFVFRAVAGIGGGDLQLGAARRGRLICPEPRCGHANPGDARYCARCGRSFQHEHDLDAYG
jgi:hypothetical protein